MAQDLSQTIQEGLAQTLTDLLGIDAKFQETTQIDRRDIQTSQLLKVNAEFEFDKLATVIKFIVPAPSASIVFNTMMGATDYDISQEIDDDTTDAMGEFVSNVSGSLVTAFNAKEIEELGKAKFHIQHKEVVDGASIENIDTIYRFLIDLDDQPITLFIEFTEEFLPFIEEISKAEPTPYKEEETPPEEEIVEEIIEDHTEIEEEIISKEPTITNAPEQEKESTSIEENESEEEIIDEETLKKSKKMKLIIIILGSLIGLIIIIFLVIFLMSSPEEEEMGKTEEIKTEMTENQEGTEQKEQQEITTQATKTLKKIDFDIKDIDIARLNGRLATLTKYEILTKEELEAQKIEENKRLIRLKKEEALKEFAKLNKEEPVKIKPQPKKEEIKPIQKKEMKQQETMMKKEIKSIPIKQIPKQPIIVKEVLKETPKEEVIQMEVKVPEVELKKTTPEKPEKLLFILTNSIKYTLFKSLVSKLDSTSARISMCNDNEGRTTILIGPFENMEQQTKMDQLIIDSNENITTTLTEFSQEEFNQRCDF